MSEEKKTYIGYDLGDGETITDIAELDVGAVKQSVQTLFVDMTMPDCNTPGKAIPTAYGYTKGGKLVFASSILADPEEIRDIHINFKRRPSDLLGPVSEQRKNTIRSLFKDGWPGREECPEVYTPAMDRFRESVTCYTNAIFTNESYLQRIHGAAVDSGSIVFCVGHPTRWDDLDVAIYRTILSMSVLGKGAYAGKPAALVMAAESRAAFLYVKDKTTADVLPKGTCALLIDIGSSTIDVTAMTSDSRNYQYNSGSNYMGARSIDFIIRQWYLDRLRKDPEDWSVYQSMAATDPSVEQALTLSCRMAKEDVYSTAAEKGRIIFADFPPARITQQELNDMVSYAPIVPVLRSFAGIPEDTLQAMGDKTWAQLFREFLETTKAEMTAQGIKVGRIILTGSASKMPFISQIVQEVYNEVPDGGILSDMNPSRSISMGLALVGPSDEKSKQFQQDLQIILEEDVPNIIEEDIPALADSISTALDHVITGIIRSRMAEWRSGRISTLEQMTDMIQRDCSEENLNRILQADDDYNRAVEDWTVNVVGRDIAVKLQGLCDRYHVSNFTLDNLNVMKVSAIDLGGFSVNPTEDLANMLSTVISLIAGIIAAIILPTVLGVIIGLISLLSMGIAVLLLEILLLIPGGGWAILLGLAGLAVVKMAASGMDGAKRELAAKLQKVDLPQWVRDRMSDSKIEKQVQKANLKAKINASIQEEESKQRIIRSVSENLSRQIIKRADDIKYVIESR